MLIICDPLNNQKYVQKEVVCYFQELWPTYAESVYIHTHTKKTHVTLHFELRLAVHRLKFPLFAAIRARPRLSPHVCQGHARLHRQLQTYQWLDLV